MSASAYLHSLRGVLRVGSRTLGSFPSAAPGQMRWLSSTLPLAGKEVIQFQPGGSPELKQILGDLYEWVILPQYLTTRQRQMIYMQKYERELNRDPITIEIDGKKHEFRYRNKVRDVPSVKKGFWKAVNHMQSRADFDRNLYPLLEGLYGLAKRKPAEPATLTKTIRRAGNAGAIGAVLKCIYEAEHTKLYLTSHEMVNELFQQLQRPVWKGAWKKEDLETALKRVQKVLDVMENDSARHRAPKAMGPLSYPFFRDPQFLAARLHLQAALALKHHKGVDKDGRVAKYAEEIVRLWPKGQGLLDCHPDEAYRPDHGMRYLISRPLFVWTAAPMVNGFRMAQEVLKKDEKHAELVKDLGEIAAKVEGEIQVALPEAVSNQRARNVYQELFPDAFLPEPSVPDGSEPKSGSSA